MVRDMVRPWQAADSNALACIHTPPGDTGMTWTRFEIAIAEARPAMGLAEYLDLRIKARDRLAAACAAGRMVDLSDLIARCDAALGGAQ